MSNEITRRSRELRNNSTDAEQVFWDAVRCEKLGHKFLRQKPIRFYINNKLRFFIADFFCKEFKLVIEIDGKIHEKQKEYDEARSHIIHQLGYTVIRFTNEEVFNNLKLCLDSLPLPRETGKGVGG